MYPLVVPEMFQYGVQVVIYFAAATAAMLSLLLSART
jgi:hypothetical protein